MLDLQAAHIRLGACQHLDCLQRKRTVLALDPLTLDAQALAVAPIVETQDKAIFTWQGTRRDRHCVAIHHHFAGQPGLRRTCAVGGLAILLLSWLFYTLMMRSEAK